MKKTKKTNACQCNECKSIYSLSEIERIYGKHSGPATKGFCSSLCYTVFVQRLQTDLKINNN